MYGKVKDDLTKEIQSIRDAGLFKGERVIMTPQGAEIEVKGGKEVLNFCANNYLGLSSHPKVIEAAHKALDEWGFGMSSVRFICGTQDIHKILEEKISKFLQTEDTILFVACFDANGGVFEPLIGAEDAIITDQLNHASIIDGIRLCKAQRYIYKHADMADLEEKLKETQNLRYRLVATDGVFSMDGDIAKLDEICALADKYDAMVMIDDAHSTGFIGETGRGTPEFRGVLGKIDIITGTLGKALGGASGGFISGRKELIELYRQRARPYLFSNTLAPVVVGASIAVLDLLSETTELRDKLEENTKYFREKMTEAGFEITPGVHPIVPIMLGKFENDAKLSQDMASDLLEEGIYVIGFYYPVVPKGQSRIRVQLSAAHDRHHLDRAIEAFTKIGKKHNVIS
ncbi:MAG: glycine C-acetyltransferase [Candidatus Aminicenantes bacterium]|nr:glycine C-acetyltransferase [Candidatus Aminicenantes bacterium]MCK4759058.1 glycine C-acetyltransferase [Candidatus Aminicenantes bacterium]